MHYTIGNTPLEHLKTFCPHGNLWAKIESRNPLASVKDRAAMGMILRGETLGLLKPGGTIVEPTSGNTGIGLAWIARKRGYQCIITMPETMSEERKKVLRFLGAQLILTEGSKGMKGAIAKAKEIEAETGAYFPNQFENPGNPEFHYTTTGPEIWEQSKGKIDIFVAGCGTGGTIMGTGKFLKEQNPDITIVALEPAEAPVLSQGESAAAPHTIPGWGPGFVPQIVDLDMFDEIVEVAPENARETSQRMAKDEGLFIGISCGAAAWGAQQIAQKNPDKNVVTIFPDSAERYCSTPLFNRD